MNELNPGLPYQPQKIKKRLSVSGEHIVYEYGDSQVIKFPFGPIYKYNADDAIRKIKNEFQIIEKYFKDFIVPSHLHIFKKNQKKTYCIIQKKVAGRPLKPKDLAQGQLKSQFKKILEINRLMFETTKYTLEFFGVSGLFFHGLNRWMENIWIIDKEINSKNITISAPENTEKELKIIDFGLVSELNMVSSSFILRWFVKWAVNRQKKLLKLYQ
ncbi:MAG: hypothetical protein ABIC19_04715 [Patescibacteria group bacterium]|nr:hypothetical protein [Patescibacteria group bacterium]